MISVDLHVHPKIARRIPFEIESFEAAARRARSLGLAGFALTEHAHHSDFWETLGAVRDRYEYSDGLFRVPPGLCVLTGMELTVAEGADVVLIGGIDQLLRFDRSLASRPTRGYHPPFRDIFGPARRSGLVMIGAHPTKDARPGSKRLRRLRKHLRRLDSLEYNGNEAFRRKVRPEIRRLAKSLKLPVVGGSDAHVWSQVGAVSTVLDLPEVSLEGLRRCISDGSTRARKIDGLRSIVRVSRRHKRIARMGER